MAFVEDFCVVNETSIDVAVDIPAPLNKHLYCEQCFPYSKAVPEAKLALSVVFFKFPIDTSVDNF